MKNFTDADVQPYALPSLPDAGKINAEASELFCDPLPWQQRGLQETATGYGAKLTSCYKISFNGTMRRLYVTCFSNSGSTWFVVKGRKIFVS